VPDHGQCPDPQCVQSHPPAVRLIPALTETLAPETLLRVSISHTRRLAIAVAVLTRPSPTEERTAGPPPEGDLGPTGRWSPPRRPGRGDDDGRRPGFRVRCLFGVDAVDLDRIEALMSRHGERFLERIASPSEKLWFLAEPSASTAGLLFAVKEAVIKAVGGRPSGFTWRSAGPMSVTPEVPEEPEVVLTSLVVGAGLTEALAVGLHLDDVLRSAAERALSERVSTERVSTERVSTERVSTEEVSTGPASTEPAFPGPALRVHGAVRYGERDGHLLAAVVLWAQQPAPARTTCRGW
jgi:phosphopantetheine--protein transferase-like protein